VQEPVCRPILPLSSLREFLDAVEKDSPAARARRDNREMLIEPDPKSVLDALLPFSFNRHIYALILLAKASEHSARMVAMKTAKDNATTLIGDLTLKFNKARQAAITQEILEIAAAQFSAA
jgi:F-type H+-transporting ATPase subunit gamma